MRHEQNPERELAAIVASLLFVLIVFVLIACCVLKLAYWILS